MDKPKITGIILAGGRSSRMGRQKGLLELGGKPLIRYAIETLEHFCSDIVISTGASCFDHLDYPTQPDRFPGAGPMGGIYTCLNRSGTDHNLVLSCDTPFVTRALLRLVMDESEGYQVVIPASKPGILEPLIGYYHKNNTPGLLSFLKNGNFTLLDYIETATYKALPVYKNTGLFPPRVFLNINSPEDLGDLQQNSRQ